MAEQQPTWGSMIWGAAKTVGIVAVAAVAGTALMNNLGTFLAGSAADIASTAAEAAGSVGAGAATTDSLAATTKTTAQSVGQWMQGASDFMGRQISSVMAGVGVSNVPDSVNTFTEIGSVATSAGNGLWELAKQAGNTIAANKGTVAAVGAGGLAVGYMLRGAEASRPRAVPVAARPVVGAHTARLNQQQLAALAAAQGRA